MFSKQKKYHNKNTIWLYWHWYLKRMNHGIVFCGISSHMINSFGWQTVVATPPITTQGLSTVCPPVTDVPASSDASLNPWMISGITLSLSCKEPRN